MKSMPSKFTLLLIAFISLTVISPALAVTPALNTAAITALTINSTAVDVSNYTSGIANINLGWGVGHFEVSYDGGMTYKELPATFIATGLKCTKIVMRGLYLISLDNATHLKYISDYTCYNPNACTVDFVTTRNTKQNKVPFVSEQFKPAISFLAPTITDTGGRKITEVDTVTGTTYGYGGPNLYKKTYRGNWSAISNSAWGSVNRSVTFCKKMSSGKLIVAVKHTDANYLHIYVSDINETNFIDKYSFPNEGGHSTSWGVSSYGTKIVFAEYKVQPRYATDPLHIYYSADDGLTWSIIHTAPATDKWHYHDVALDPYSNPLRIWFCNGDAYSSANIYYTDDLGVTWNKFWDDGKAKFQATTICILPDVVLFGTDSAQFRGVMRYIRGLTQPEYDSYPVIDPIYKANPYYGDLVVSTGRGMQFGNEVYFVGENGKLVGTRDGINFYTLWEEQSTLVGFEPWLHNVWRTDAGKLIGRYRNNNTEYYWEADAPTWVKIL